MRKQPSIEVIRAAHAVAEALGASPADVHISMPIICDHCHREDEEAFPYDVYDSDGRHWDDLCNDCFEELGCEIEPGEWDIDDPWYWD